MKNDLLEEKKDLTPQELAILESEFQKHRKSPVVLWLLWLFTGNFGGHRYYLGDKGRAITHTIVFIIMLIVGFSFLSSADTEVEIFVYAPLAFALSLSIPALWALVDAFFINRRLKKKNAEIEMKLINKIKSLRS